MNAKLMKFLRDEDGVTAIEYGLIAGLIAVGIIATVTVIGTDLTSIFSNISTHLSTIVAGLK